MAVKTLLIDGFDPLSIEGLTYRTFLLFGTAQRRTGDAVETAPGINGQKAPAGAPWDTFTVTLPMRLVAASEGAVADALWTLEQAIQGANGAVALTRKQLTSGGSLVSATAKGLWLGFSNFSTGNALDIDFDLTFLNLSGAWYDGTNWRQA